jgi:hypothetical protein
MAAPEAEQQNLLLAHDTLYEYSFDAVRLRIKGGQIALAFARHARLRHRPGRRPDFLGRDAFLLLINIPITDHSNKDYT